MAKYVLFPLFTFFFFFSYSYVHAASGVGDQLVQMITNPYVIPFFLTIGLVGVAIELLFPGLIFPGTIGISAFCIYFLGYYLSGSLSWDAPVLFVVGLILLILEVVVPSFGIIGILGALFLFSSFALTVPNWQVGIISIGAAITLVAFIVWTLSRFTEVKGVWKRFILQESQQSTKGYISQQDRSFLLGKKGVTKTPLRPSGYAYFEDQLQDVVSQGAPVPASVPVEVIAVEGTRVVVREIK